MEPRIRMLEERTLAGKRLDMSLLDDTTSELWRSFMQMIGNIHGRTGTDKYNVRIYPAAYFQQFAPGNSFQKWAAVEVDSFDDLPRDIQTLIVPAGLYAVFHYKGLNTDPAIFQYIYGQWLPNSNYQLDNRPHFEILGSAYKNGDPESEEEICIPVRSR